MLTGIYESFSDYNDNNPTVELEETTTFTLTVVSPDGCIGTDQVTITVEDIPIVEVPSAFSPNGDNVNDLILPYLHDIIALERFTVYNRWGEEVFTTNAINVGWDGMVDGKEAEIGTYVYIVVATATSGEEEMRQGNFVLVR